MTGNPGLGADPGRFSGGQHELHESSMIMRASRWERWAYWGDVVDLAHSGLPEPIGLKTLSGFKPLIP